MAAPAFPAVAPQTRITAPAVGASAVTGPVQMSGIATDDNGVAAVHYAVRNLSTGSWLQSNGQFDDPRVDLQASLDQAGNPSTGWSAGFNAIDEGDYALIATATDVDGAEDPKPAFRRVTITSGGAWSAPPGSRRSAIRATQVPTHGGWQPRSTAQFSSATTGTTRFAGSAPPAACSRRSAPKALARARTWAHTALPWIPVTERIYLADMNHPWEIDKFAADGTFIRSFSTYVFGKTVPYPYITRIAVDSQGVVYGISSHNVPVTFKSVVVKWNPDGTFNSSWGVTGPADGQIELTHGIEIGPNDDVYLVDTYKKKVQVFTKDGIYLRSFGEGHLDGDLRGVRIDHQHGWVYVVDAAPSQIEKFALDGTWLASFGSEGTGPGQFRDGGRELAIDSDSNVHAADFGNNRVNVYNANGVSLYAYPSPPIQPPDDGFNQPQGIAVSASGDDLYTADTYNHRLQRWTRDGTLVSKWGYRGTAAPNAMNYPRGVAVDPRNGDVLLMNSREGNVKRYSRTGNYISQFGSWGTGAGQFNLARGIAVAPDGTIAVADSINLRVQVFTGDGTLLWTAPCGVKPVSGKGPGLLGGCTGVAFDPAGNLYAAAVTEHRIYKWSSWGSPVTTWGTLGTAAGQLKGPYGIAVYSGTIYVTESNNGRVSAFTLTGTYLGSFGAKGTDLGQFRLPRDIAIDGSGRMYVVDSQNEEVDVFEVAG